MAFAFTFSNDGTNATVIAFTGSPVPETLNIPATDGLGHPVIAIAASVFFSETGITSVTFPETLTSIGNQAFYSCLSLASVTFPAGLTSIGNAAFDSCFSLASVTFPAGLTSIGNTAFDSCTDLTSVTFNGPPPTFGDDVFLNTPVTSINAPFDQGWPGVLVISSDEGGSTSYSVILFGSGNICFLADTPVETDQGIVAISEIKPDIHTIRGQTVLAVTRTVMIVNERLFVFEEDALGEDCPSQKTTCTPNHKIMYNGEMVEAFMIANSFNGSNPAVYRVDYDNQLLYNVVLPEHSTMVVNNMTVETLAPYNPIARQFMKPFVAAAEDRISLVDAATAICA